MSALKNYLKEEFQWRNFILEHSRPADFYLSVWQSNRSTATLLAARTLLFLTSLGITLASLISYIVHGWGGVWWVYLTHWGLTVMTLATGFAFGVSARCHFYGPISGEYRLPWYVKTYWVLFNIAVPLAFLITIFYWTVLYEETTKEGSDKKADIEEELDKTYDIIVHGVNSILMFILLGTSSHPGRLLHIYQPIIFAVVFFFFTLFYHLGGGKNRLGEPYVYPVLNWNKAGQTVGVGFLTALLLALVYVFTVSIVAARDAISRRFIKPQAQTPEPEGVPLRQQTQAV